MQSSDDNASARRKQVLAAAREQFAADGFHGACMAAIAKRAHMSVGHIYHYFESKEAIIAAIVEERLAHLLAMFDRVEHEPDVPAALIARVEQDLSARLEASDSALELEILAEAARNPEIAAIVQQADARLQERIRALLRRHPQVGRSSSLDLDERIELAAALFDGLVVRTVRHPEFDRKKLLAIVRTFHVWLNT